MSMILSHIVRKRFSKSAEDIATDGLAYLLESNEAIRQGMNKMLAGILPGLPELRFRAQDTEGGVRPDLWGFDATGPRVLIENKFWAGLTDNQPVSYLHLLTTVEQPSLLLVVAPAARRGTLWRELTRRVEHEGIALMTADAQDGPVRSVMTSLGPALALTSWRSVLSALDLDGLEDPAARSDLAQLRALCDAADEDAFLPLSGEELTDQRLPALILQLGSLVQAVTDLGIERGFLDVNGLRPQASWDRIGRYVRFEGHDGEGFGAWVGIHFPYWKSHGSTPLWLVFGGNGFSRTSEVRPLLERWGIRTGALVVAHEGEVAVGLELLAGEEQVAVAAKVVEQLSQVREALRF